MSEVATKSNIISSLDMAVVLSSSSPLPCGTSELRTSGNTDAGGTKLSLAMAQATLEISLGLNWIRMEDSSPSFLIKWATCSSTSAPSRRFIDAAAAETDSSTPTMASATEQKSRANFGSERMPRRVSACAATPLGLKALAILASRCRVVERLTELKTPPPANPFAPPREAKTLRTS